MIYRRIVFIILFLISFTAVTMNAYEPSKLKMYTRDQFQDYWYNNGAEISRFELRQLRYGEIHDGDAVLVFVTEKMNPYIQIKADNPGPRDIPVLKLNAVRKFFTGIYPYSILTSIFAPLDIQIHPLPLKISSSVQEWCGHVYTQMNLRESTYQVKMHSYFEKEGDQVFEIKSHIPEDAIWTMVRIAPHTLPQGEFVIIPGTVYARLLHQPITPQKAVATLSSVAEKSLEGNPLLRYEIDFQNAQRTLRIFFEKEFPYRIQKWDETYRGLIGSGSKVMTTCATRTHTIMDPYWRHHQNKDRSMLKNLGLSTREMGSR